MFVGQKTGLHEQGLPSSEEIPILDKHPEISNRISLHPPVEMPGTQYQPKETVCPLHIDNDPDHLLVTISYTKGNV